MVQTGLRGNLASATRLGRHGRSEEIAENVALPAFEGSGADSMLRPDSVFALVTYDEARNLSRLVTQEDIAETGSARCEEHISRLSL